MNGSLTYNNGSLTYNNGTLTYNNGSLTYNNGSHIIMAHLHITTIFKKLIFLILNIKIITL